MRALLYLIFTALVALQPTPGVLVYDFANVLPQEVFSELEQSLNSLKSDTTAEVAVVTVSSLENETVDEYANALFNRWGIGQRETNNGLLFLVAPNERRTRIEVGRGLEELIPDSLAGEILDTYVIPEFKKGDVPSGISKGTHALIDLLRKYPEAARGKPGSAPFYVFTPVRKANFLAYGGIGASIIALIVGIIMARKKSFSPIFFTIGICLILGLCVAAGFAFFQVSSTGASPFPIGGSIGTGLLALFYNVKKFRRYRPHYCDKCSTKLTLLNDLEEDKYLDKVQLLEENIKSVDYDVWLCPACLVTETEQYVKSFSGYSNCPKCTHRTYKEKSKTIIPATTMSTGLREINGECCSCRHKAKRTEVIPRVTQSSSSSSSGGGSSGGSFGGGSSGGGGASRSW